MQFTKIGKFRASDRSKCPVTLVNNERSQFALYVLDGEQLDEEHSYVNQLSNLFFRICLVTYGSRDI